jgi:D-amino-acid dehydrogenase
VKLEDGGEIEADAFVIATGAEAAALSRQCGTSLPLQAGKGYSVTIDRPRLEVRYPLYLGDAKIGITPFGGALRVAGTMELSGINLTLDARRLEALERATERDLPGALAGEGRESWVGMRPITPDGLPILGRLPRSENVFVATGHQMLGVTLAPSTGKAMAELIAEGESSVDLEPFSPARF